MEPTSLMLPSTGFSFQPNNGGPVDAHAAFPINAFAANPGFFSPHFPMNMNMMAAAAAAQNWGNFMMPFSPFMRASPHGMMMGFDTQPQMMQFLQPNETITSCSSSSDHSDDTTECLVKTKMQHRQQDAAVSGFKLPAAADDKGKTSSSHHQHVISHKRKAILKPIATSRIELSPSSSSLPTSSSESPLMSSSESESDETTSHSFGANTHPRGYWMDFENLRKELENFISKAGDKRRMPTQKELRQGGATGSLKDAIRRHGGTAAVAEKLGLETLLEGSRQRRGLISKGKERKPRRFWSEFENVASEIKRLMREQSMDRMPTLFEIKKTGNLSLYRALYTHGGWETVARRIGVPLYSAFEENSHRIHHQHQSKNVKC